MDVIFYDRAESPIGQLWAARTSRGLCSVTHDVSQDQFLNSLRIVFQGELRRKREPFEELFTRFEAYFNGRPVSFLNLPFDLRGTDFQKAVWQSVAKIPYGSVLSYKDVAAKAGYPNAYRAAGSAVGKNRLLIVVPCHRVIKSDGSLGGFGGRPEVKRFLLKLEGLKRF